MKNLTIKSGLIYETQIEGVPFRRVIAQPVTGFNFPNRNRPKTIGITMHDTGDNGTAYDHAIYVQRVEREGKGWQASYHFCVDDREIVQILPTGHIAWHAGDGQGNGNQGTIAIEVCEVGDRAKAEANAVKLAGALLAYFGGRVYKHQDWNGKYCPHIILKRGAWGAYQRSIYNKRDEILNRGHDKIPNGQDLYRVQVGAFKYKRNAENLLKELRRAGFKGYIK